MKMKSLLFFSKISKFLNIIFHHLDAFLQFRLIFCRKRKFEVLINTDRAARLEWRSYNKFAGVPVGAVAAVDENSEPASGDYNVFIGRHLGESGIWRPGAVEVPRRSSYSSFGKMR